MANKSEKLALNVAGTFYVDNSCIGCGMCQDIAPDYFKIDDASGLAYVCKQPEEDSAKNACQEAKDGCPVEAIGNDG